jgi:SAM-dependent methyltransferase
MVDFAAGRQAPAWLRVAPGRRLTYDLAAYFAPVTAQERALLELVEGPVLGVGCGPARHARLLQARGLTAIGLDRSPLALGLARALGLRRWLRADVRSGPLPPARTALLLDGNLGLAGTPAGAMQLLDRLAAACGPGGRLLVGGRAPRHGWLRPLVIRDEYRNLIGPRGGGCRPVSQPSSTLPPRPAGASSTPSRMARATGPPSLSTLHDRLPCRLRRRPGISEASLVALPASLGPCRPGSGRLSRCCCCSPRGSAAARQKAPLCARVRLGAVSRSVLVNLASVGSGGSHTHHRAWQPGQAWTAVAGARTAGPPRTRTRRWTNRAKRTSIRPGSGRCGVIPCSRWW